MHYSSRCVRRLIPLVVLAALTLPLTASSTPAQSPPEIRQLEIGKPIERELRGGQSHVYEVQLAAGQYLSAVIDQRGIDVAITVIGTDGKPLAETDGPNGALGPERVGVIAEVAGVYRLEVHSSAEDAPAGRYEIRIVEWRAAKASDRTLLEARALTAQSVQATQEGHTDEAVRLAERARDLCDQALGQDAPERADFLYNLADLYSGKRDYKNAERLHRQALVIREQTLGPRHPDVALSLNALAKLADTMGDYVGAEPLHQRALALREAGLGPDHTEVATFINDLAVHYFTTGDYAKAEPLYQRAVTIAEKAFGPQHPTVARFLTSLGELYRKRGDYAKAEALLERAVATFEQAHDPALARPLTSLAHLYYLRGDYAKAEPLFQRAIKLSEQALGPQHPDVAQPVNGLALLYHTLGDYAKAEALYQRALAISEAALGPQHPDVAQSLGNLAWLYKARGEYERAEPLFARALAIAEKAFGPTHPYVATLLNNLAVLYYVKEDYARAEPMFERALAVCEQALGPQHPFVATLLNNLAQLHEARGDLRRAVAFKARSNDIFERQIALNVATGSERQKLLYLTTLAGQTDSTISLHVRAAPQDAAARRLALTTVLRRKGRALDAMADSIGALRRRLDAKDQALLDQLTAARAELAGLALRGPATGNAARLLADLHRLEAEVERLEAEVSARSAEFRAQAQPVTIEAVQAALPEDAALIEFVSFRPFDPKYKKRDDQFGARRYVAYVLRHQGEPKWVDLGEAQAIDEAVTALRRALRDPQSAQVKPLARQLDERVMRPVRKLLGKRRQVLLSPDGALNLIPFGGLVDEHGDYLIKRYRLIYLSSGRDLLRLQTPTPSRQRALILADPDFGGAAQNSAQRGLQVNAGATSGVDLSQVYFEPLPGTNEEARALEGLLSESRLLLKGEATEAAIKQVAGPMLLHVATHGFFLEDAETPPTSGDRGLFVSGAQPGAGASRLENALLRSGLVMAGANLHKGGDEDGILTALEVAGLNLWGTKLVVLSACETGVGEVKNGEGVYGLRRALVLAGAESQMLSLWKVDDAATRDLMIDYYTRLKAGAGRNAALRQAQLKMLATPRYQHPYFWASFIESGEWANLDGKR
ncbi:MAG TPA: CHAT domain-containing tetratricopeptide repeat protein [Blastocatellia bacterium]|nr:CHAT domain-containing tetratricopeptide repeat protein [Blastocatellia bacterium]